MIWRVLAAGAAATVLGGWGHPGGDPGFSRYAPDAQITPENAASLREAWRFSSGDLAARPDTVLGWKMQVTPILFEGSVMFCTPRNEVIALDPATGRDKWRFDPRIDSARFPTRLLNCRGVVPFTDEAAAQGAACRTRVLSNTIDLRLIALDARTGKPCQDFGDGGTVRIAPERSLDSPDEMTISSAPAVVNGVVVVGSGIADGQKVEALSGMVRAFDARTGAALWTWDAIPRDPADPRMATWEGGARSGAANVWAPVSVDPARGLVFLPTGSASPDYYGGTRPGTNADANSIVALEAKTGRRVWAFQTVRHDIWDYDVPAAPALVTLIRPQGPVDAVIQVTKMGFIFTLDRDTGAPVFPIAERAVPKSDVPGEWTAPTQPVPTLPKALTPEEVNPFGLTFWDYGVCKDLLGKLKYDGLFTPPSLQGTVVHPFSGGGMNWGGAAFHPGRQILVVNSSDAAEFARLIPRAEDRKAGYAGERFPQDGAPYTLDRGLIRSPLGAPCTDPPWGLMHAIDMSTGQELWRVPFGTFEDLVPFGDVLLPKGTPTQGGPIVTETGVIFIGAAMDNYLRALDLSTGRELWKGRLPGGGQANPMTYTWAGRQYVVIAAGGHGLMGTRNNDTIVAFALSADGPDPWAWTQRPTNRWTMTFGAAVLSLIGLIWVWRRRAQR
jgi:quinoprotein glucose dehydrogenase